MDENVKNNQISDEQLECVGGGNSSLTTGDNIQPATRRDTRINHIMSETEMQQAGEEIFKKVSPFGL